MNEQGMMAVDPRSIKAFEDCMAIMDSLLNELHDVQKFADGVAYVGIGILSSALMLTKNEEDARLLKSLLLKAADAAMENYLKVIDTSGQTPN